MCVRRAAIIFWGHALARIRKCAALSQTLSQSLSVSCAPMWQVCGSGPAICMRCSKIAGRKQERGSAYAHSLERSLSPTPAESFPFLAAPHLIHLIAYLFFCLRFLVISQAASVVIMFILKPWAGPSQTCCLIIVYAS